MGLWSALRAALVRLVGAPGGPDGAPEVPEDPEEDREEAPLPGALPGEEPVAVVPIEDAIDLHGFAPRDIPSVVEEYLAEAASKGFREVRLIHGRGKGVQRAVVRRLLASNALVVSFGDAPGSRGGWGATLVQLRAPSRGKGRAGAGRAGRGGRRRG